LLGGALGLGLGIVNEHGNTPAVSVTFMQGRLPGFPIASDPFPVERGGNAIVTLNTMKLFATSARLSASKTFGTVGVTLGYGVDGLALESTVETQINGHPGLATQTASEAMDPTIRRSLLFSGVNYRWHGLALSGEVGLVGGEKGPSEINSFSSGGGSRSYVSVGVRVGGN
jgi:hypothetical protein